MERQRERESVSTPQKAAVEAVVPAAGGAGAAGAPPSARDLTGTALTTGRLVLSPPTAADVDVLTEICQDPDIQAWTMVPSPYRREHAEQFVNVTVPQGMAAGTDAVFALHHAVSGQILGMVGLHGITTAEDKHGAQAEIGYWTA